MPNWNALAVSPHGAVMSLDYVAGPHSWQPNGRALAWTERLPVLVDPAEPLFDILLEAELFTGLAFAPDGTLYLATEGAINQILAISPDRKLVGRWWAPNRDHRSAPAEPLTDEHEPSLAHPPGVLAVAANGDLYYSVFRSPRKLGEHAFVFDYWPSVWRLSPGGRPEHVGGRPEAPLQTGLPWREAGLGLVRSICPQPDGGLLLHVTRPVDAGSPAAARVAGATGLAETRAGDLPSYEHLVRIDPDGTITAVWGSGENGLDASGQPVESVSLEGLRAVAVTPDGQAAYLLFNSRHFAGLVRLEGEGRLMPVEAFDFPHSIAPVLAVDGDGLPYWLETPSVMRLERGRGRNFAPSATFWAGEGP